LTGGMAEQVKPASAGTDQNTDFWEKIEIPKGF
jgi:hypothetical protein